MSGAHVLLQYGEDFRNMRFEDLEGRMAFSLRTVEETPNLILRLTRESLWASQHPSVMGPTSSFFYFGPSRTQGYLGYGNSPTQPMANFRRQKSGSSTSRYFSAQNGVEYKWRLSPHRLEHPPTFNRVFVQLKSFRQCVDNKGAALATWEIAQPGDEFHGRLTIKHAALSMITELLTTLTLNRIALSLNW
ncbi:hypothetical protein EIP91_004337 [Steccherinum ochraceum]|uniref:Uncharacterized protein n=1 Tax=Steccherinum ochraceum TaxID=92696 RepID=A0A4R0RF47_9APHY|nr:hypothetical protein EIP91_004337 [Steccherinum ochraceum]